MKKLEKFEIKIKESVLKDLKERIINTRFAPDLDNNDEKYGLSTDYLKSYLDYWANNFDWRKVEKEMNTYNQHRVDIDGSPVHFIYEKSKSPNAIPIVLLHGWPWTFWMWKELIHPLTTADSNGLSFDVIVLSLPGFTFSTPVTRSDLNYSTMADMVQKLMTETLGYEKYAVAGSDYGALITSQLGHKYSDSLIGIHLGQPLIPIYFTDQERPWDLTGGGRIPEGVPEDLKKGIIKLQDVLASHVAVHMLDAQTLSHGLNDSPAGMLAWILKRWKTWSDQNADFDDKFSKDEVLAHATLYWVTQSISSSIRAYKNANLYPWKPSHDRVPQIEAPAGFTFLTGEVAPPLATPENRIDMFKSDFTYSWYKTVFAKAYGEGGHFGPWENPKVWISDLFEHFRMYKR